MKGFETMPTSNKMPEQKQKTIEELQEEQTKKEAYEEKILSPSALAVKELVKKGLKDKFGEITEEDLNQAFKSLELSPIDYLNNLAIDVKKLTSKHDRISKADAPEIRTKLKKAWQEINIANNKPDINKDELKRLISFFTAVEELLDNQKL